MTADQLTLTPATSPARRRPAAPPRGDLPPADPMPPVSDLPALAAWVAGVDGVTGRFDVAADLALAAERAAIEAAERAVTLAERAAVDAAAAIAPAERALLRDQTPEAHAALTAARVAAETAQAVIAAARAQVPEARAAHAAARRVFAASLLHALPLDGETFRRECVEPAAARLVALAAEAADVRRAIVAATEAHALAVGRAGELASLAGVPAPRRGPDFFTAVVMVRDLAGQNGDPYALQHIDLDPAR